MKKLMSFQLVVLAVLMSSFALYADDTAMFGGESIDLDPNVLIIFDNSGSMDDLALSSGEVYNHNTDYTNACPTCTFERNRVYYRSGGSWLNFTSNYTNIDCSSARNGLVANGEWSGSLRTSSPFSCSWACWGCSSRVLRTGNYRNYLLSDRIAVYERKIDIAKREIIQVIKETPMRIRWGLMVYNYEEGGYIVSAVKDRGLNRYYDYPTYAQIPEEDRQHFTEAEWNATRNLFTTQIINRINAFEPETWTPLAETLAEAGRYYAGAMTYYGGASATTDSDTEAFVGGNRNNAYRSPIDYRCRSNNVVLITDGISTQDRGALLTTNNYLNSRRIGDYDGDGVDPGSYSDNGSDYLDDVARFLYNEDLILSGNDASGTPYGNYGQTGYESRIYKQYVNTYTIGFEIDHPLLQDTADNGQGKVRDSGEGLYFTTSDDISLSSALRIVLSDIVSGSATYAAPVVPVSRANKTYAGKSLYLGLFSPSEASPGFWRGNLKKFGFLRSSNPAEPEVLRDRYGNPVAKNPDGTINRSVLTAWFVESSPAEDGLLVNKGGVGKVLMNGNSGRSRSFKTNKPGMGMIEFNKTNITAADLGLATDSQRDNLIDWIRGEGVYAPNSGTSWARQWLLGDILHSTPAIIYDYSNNRNVLFVGSNDGFLHCFVDSEGNDGESLNLQNDVVYEAWSFVPWEMVASLKNLPTEEAVIGVSGDSQHNIFIDGNPIIYESGDHTYLTFGLRRGGSSYYTIDVSNYENPGTPSQIAGSILFASRGETLGESWSTPIFSTLRTAGGSTQDVVFYAGGYDTNQDTINPGTSDTKGRAVFAVEATSPTTLVDRVTFTRAGASANSYSRIRHCITDLTIYDDDDDGCDDVIYAATLGGDVLAFNDMNNDGTWDKRWLFSAQPDSGVTSKLRKFLFAPGIAQESWGDWVYLASGDREDPLDENLTNIVSNRIYAIKNRWKTSPYNSSWTDGTGNNTLTDGSLVDITLDILQSSAHTDEQKSSHLAQILAGNGWYITLENSGEKAISTVLVFEKVAYFTTYQPTSASVADPCTTSSVGISRLYGVDYANGNAVYDFWNSAGTVNTPDGALSKSDRIIKTASGMMPEPKIAITEEGPVVVWGDRTIPAQGNRLIQKYFFRQE